MCFENPARLSDFNPTNRNVIQKNVSICKSDKKKGILALLLLCFMATAARAQELEPRVYANIPKGMNAIALVFAHTTGNVLTDPALPISDFKLKANTLGTGFVRTFALAKKLARVQVAVPFTYLEGKARFRGMDTSGVRNGFGDARIRLGINLWGSPALDRKDFRDYEQKMIVGASIVVSVPIGLYYKDKLINLGSNRWAFKPEIGVSKRFKRVYAEAYTGVWFYTANTEYLVDKTLKQGPVLSLQGHVCYYFKNRAWIGVNGNWFNGGATLVNGRSSGDLRDNWRLGVTFSVPIARVHSVKFQFHTGAFTHSGYDYDLIALGYQYIFF